MSVSVGVSKLWCTGMVFMQSGVKVNGVYYCDVLLLKQLLPDISQAAGDFYFSVHHAWANALSCCDTTLDFTLDVWPPNRPDHNPVTRRPRQSFRNAFIRNSNGHETSLMCCVYTQNDIYFTR